MKFQDFEQQLVNEGLLEIEPEITAEDILIQLQGGQNK